MALPRQPPGPRSQQNKVVARAKTKLYMKSVEILESLGIQIHVDGVSPADWKALASRSYIHGCTSNPSLCRKLGVTDYERFCKDMLEVSQGKPVSLEVLSDDFSEMKRQALKLASWGDNVLVKIPVTNTKGEDSWRLIIDLVKDGVKVNVTAVTTDAQIMAATYANPYVISVFAGRIADRGDDPRLYLGTCRQHLKNSKTKLLWASTREAYNIIQAAGNWCDIITVPLPILAKAIDKFGCDLEAESLSLVRQFHSDAMEAGFTL